MDQAKQAINAVKVYKNGLSGKNVNIAILDTGVYGHELLNDKIVCFNDYIGGKTKIYDDSNDHRTRETSNYRGRNKCPHNASVASTQTRATEQQETG